MAFDEAGHARMGGCDRADFFFWQECWLGAWHTMPWHTMPVQGVCERKKWGYSWGEWFEDESMKSVWAMSLLGLAFLPGCASEPVAEQPSPEVSPAIASSPSPIAASPTTPDRLLPPPPAGQNLPAPMLIPPTTVLGRLPQVNAGRSDPFAAIATAPIVVSNTAAPAPNQPAAPIPTVTPLQPPALPLVTTAPLPLLQPMPADLSQLPSVPVDAIPVSPAPARVIDAIEVSGVVQVGGRVSAIVRVPDEGTSRYVNAGEYLANGRILVKRINITAEEPTVVLEEDGREVIKTVGSSGVL